MKIISWNVNGIRAVIKKGFVEWLQENDPDILCIQETKAFENQVPPEIRYLMKDYDYIWHGGDRAGYAGTATFWKKGLDVIDSKNYFEEIEHFHEDGRVVELRFNYSPPDKGDKGGYTKDNINPPSPPVRSETKYQGGVIRHPYQGEAKIALLNLYFPNGGTRANGTEMLGYKLDFYEHFIHYINTLRDEGYEVITCGDFNICHKEIDIARPKENVNSIGFLPIERAKLDKLSENGYIDIFRKFNPGLRDQYTWWSYRAGARPRNVGRRLDYFWTSKGIADVVKNMYHQTDVLGSDHCPISLEI